MTRRDGGKHSVMTAREAMDHVDKVLTWLEGQQGVVTGKEGETMFHSIAIAVAIRLRDGMCIHGIPEQVRAAESIEPWGKDATFRPLCDACVISAVREVLAEKMR